MTEIFLERKKNKQIHELISNMWLILSYTVQLVIPNVCTKLQNPKSSSFREIFDRKKLTNTHAHTQTEKAKTIYPLYTSYAGGIKISKSTTGPDSLVVRASTLGAVGHGSEPLSRHTKGVKNGTSSPLADARNKRVVLGR